jgi:mannose-6-phosphate isomerase-like protein (cupin superfamily)
MWRGGAGQDEIVPLAPGVCLTIPVGIRFQFRALGGEPLTAFAVTLPPWPSEGDATPVEGPWTPTVRGGPVAPTRRVQ